jgi:hypothetical protein
LIGECFVSREGDEYEDEKGYRNQSGRQITKQNGTKQERRQCKEVGANDPQFADENVCKGVYFAGSHGFPDEAAITGGSLTNGRGGSFDTDPETVLVVMHRGGLSIKPNTHQGPGSQWVVKRQRFMRNPHPGAARQQWESPIPACWLKTRLRGRTGGPSNVQAMIGGLTPDGRFLNLSSKLAFERAPGFPPTGQIKPG